MEGTVETGADLVATVEPNFFDDVTPDTPAIETSPDATTDDVIETPADIDPPSETAVDDEPPADDEETPEEEPVAAAPADPNAEALPDGVSKGKDRNGKEGLFVTPERWKTIYDGSHKTIQQVSEIIGEPATLESLQLREQAFQAQEMLFNDINSGDPKAQAKVVNYFLDQMNTARESGETGIDATVPFAQTFYAAVKEKSPDGYANLRLMGARDLATELFDAAARNGDPDLFTSVQHIVRAITGAPKGTDSAGVRAIAERMGIPFHSKAEMANLAKGADPVQQLRQRNQELEAQLNGRTTTSQAAQFKSWQTETETSIDQGIAEDAVQPALAAVAKAWEKFPNEYKANVVDKLHSKVAEIVMADPRLKAKVSALQNRAKMATSAQVRAQLATEIRQAYTNRAKLAADPQGGTFRAVINDANKILTGLSNSTHARRSAAQGRTAPTRGAQGSVNRSITPGSGMPNGIFDPSVAVRQGAEALR